MPQTPPNLRGTPRLPIPLSIQHLRFHSFAAVFIAAIPALFSHPAFANTDTWTGNSDLWSNPADWSNNLLPADGDDVTITPSDGISRTITYDYTGPNITLNSLTLDLTPTTDSNTTTLSMSANTLTTVIETIGNNGTATFNQSGGNNTINNFTVANTPGNAGLILGANSGSNGTYNLSGGTLTANLQFEGGNGTFTTYEEIIGNLGNGTFNQSGGINTIPGIPYSALEIGFSYGSNGFYSLSGNSTLTAGGEIIGRSGNGTFTQTSGNNTITSNSFFYLGDKSGSNGTYNLSGNGSLTTGSETIGYSGNGTFTQNGGKNTLNSSGGLTLASQSGSNATYYLENGTLLSIFGEAIGGGGNGAFIQTGGNNNGVTGIGLGNGNGSTGTYILSGANSSLVASQETLGTYGSGTVNQTDGKNTINGSTGGLFLGYYSGSSGNYTLAGNGTLITTSLVYGEIIGNFGNGTFTQTGGFHTISGTLTLASQNGSSGTYGISNGTLSANKIQINANGDFIQTGGIITANTSITNAGIITLAGGSLTSPIKNSGTITGFGNITSSNFTNSGNITFTSANQLTITTNSCTNSGNFTNAGSLQSSVNITNSGNFTQTGPQTWSNGTTFTNSGNATLTTDTGTNLTSPLSILNTAGKLLLSTPQHLHSLNITGGNVTLPTSPNTRQDTGIVLKTSNLSIAPTSTLDVTNHDLIIGNTSYATINNEIINTFGAGTGGGSISSSTAAAAGTFLVPLDAGAFGTTSFDNVAIDQPNSIIIKYDTFGDVDLNGVVDGNDIGAVESNFGATTTGILDIFASWTAGDVNFDGIVDGNDIGAVESNFGATPEFASFAGSSSSPSFTSSPSAVPEPASLFLLGLGSAGMLIKRKRRTM